MAKLIYFIPISSESIAKFLINALRVGSVYTTANNARKISFNFFPVGDCLIRNNLRFCFTDIAIVIIF